MKLPVTLDGHYFVVRGRLWRMANPGLDDVTRDHLVARLMTARRAVCDAKKAADREAEATAHRAMDEVKQALGERGPVWWDDGALARSSAATVSRPCQAAPRGARTR